MCLILNVYLLIPWNNGKLNFLLEDYTNSLDIRGLSQDSSEHILHNNSSLLCETDHANQSHIYLFTEMGVSRKYHISKTYEFYGFEASFVSGVPAVHSWVRYRKSGEYTIE